MLTSEEATYVYRGGCLPEHLTGYVRCISGAEPFLEGEYLYFLDDAGGVLIFIGYSLDGRDDGVILEGALGRAVRQHNPSQVALLSPVEVRPAAECIRTGRDAYSRLDLENLVIRQKLRNTLTRAERDLTIETGRDLKREHRRLIREFFKHHTADDETAYLFGKIPEYVAASDSALVISARTRKGKLSAFDVADFGSADYGYYMFNFVSRKRYVPGASDLLLLAITGECRRRGKRYLNMGLGINPGIGFFKRKWGAERFCDYYYIHYMR